MRGFAPLLFEAIGDAMRRRVVAAIVIVCVLSLLLLDSCTASCHGEIVVNDEADVLAGVEGMLALLGVVVLGLWTVVLAGVLAADMLRETLEDGSAHLALSRPIGRETFAAARLVGVLAIALVAGAVLLGAATGLLSARNGLPPGPVLGAAAACALSCVVVASLAMGASLVLPRLATVLLVLAGVGIVALANAFVRIPQVEAQWLHAIDRWGPPFGAAMAAPLGSWVSEVPVGDAGDLLVRLGAWAVASVVLLLLGFRRIEL